jgi:hypothetical protein
MFVKYEGRGKLPPATATPIPMDAVIVANEIAKLAQATDTPPEEEEAVAPRVLETTVVVRRPRSNWSSFVVAGVVLGLAVVVGGLWVHSREESELRGVGGGPSAMPSGRAAATSVTPSSTALANPTTEPETAPPSSAIASPSAVTTALASSPTPVRSVPRPLPSSASSAEGRRRADFDPAAAPY